MTNAKKPTAPAARPNQVAPAKAPTPAATAKAPAPAKVDPPKAASAPELDLDDDDDIDAPAGAKAESAGGGKSRAERDAEWAKLPTHKRIAVRLTNEVSRLEKQAAALANWPTDGEHGGLVTRTKERTAEAVAALKSAAEALNALPDTFKARVAKASTKVEGAGELKAGDLVRITDKRVEEYKGLLEDDMMAGIKVLEIRGNKVVGQTKDGLRAMIARGHVCLDTAAQA